jgi:hypothetical protein
MTRNQQRSDYNREIKEYESLKKLIEIEEQTLEVIEKTIIKSRYKHKLTMLNINNDIVKHFNDVASRIHPEIVEGLLEFVGYIVTPYNLFKVYNSDLHFRK